MRTADVRRETVLVGPRSCGSQGRRDDRLCAPLPPDVAGGSCAGEWAKRCAGLAGVDECFRVCDDLRGCGRGEQHLHNRFGEWVGAFAEAGDREVDVVDRSA